MPKLPRASGDKHVSAFKAAGWHIIILRAAIIS